MSSTSRRAPSDEAIFASRAARSCSSSSPSAYAVTFSPSSSSRIGPSSLEARPDVAAGTQLPPHALDAGVDQEADVADRVVGDRADLLVAELFLEAEPQDLLLGGRQLGD